MLTCHKKLLLIFNHITRTFPLQGKSVNLQILQAQKLPQVGEQRRSRRRDLTSPVSQEWNAKRVTYWLYGLVRNYSVA
jgi:hypothetical protein